MNIERGGVAVPTWDDCHRLREDMTWEVEHDHEAISDIRHDVTVLKEIVHDLRAECARISAENERLRVELRRDGAAELV